MIIIYIDFSKSCADVFVLHDLMQVKVQRSKRFQDFHTCLDILSLSFQFFFLLLQIHVVMIDGADHLKDFIFALIKGWLCCHVFHISQKLCHFCEWITVRVHFKKWHQIIYCLELRECIFKLHLIFGKIPVCHAVDVGAWSGNAQELHLNNHFAVPPI